MVARGFRESVVVAQAAAELEEEWIHAAVGQVRHADACGIAPTASAATGDGVDFPAVAFCDEQGFVARVVDGVDDGVEAGVEDFGGGFFVKEAGDDLDFASWVDGECALGHGFGFLAADLAIHGVELAIHVGDADFVQIDECDVADAGSGEGFHGP